MSLKGIRDAVQTSLDNISGSISTFSTRSSINLEPTTFDTSLSTHGSDILVTGYRDYGGLEFNGTPFIGVKVDFLVMVD